MRTKVFSKAGKLPTGHASDKITNGCIVLEGGAFRGVYTSGVLDALMKANINMACTVGVSAGALNGMNYVSGQIGRSGRINLLFRHDPHYVGLRAYGVNRGIIGFDFILDCLPDEPFDWARFNNPNRRFIAVATSCLDGKAKYFEKENCNIVRAVKASASMPYVSMPVEVDCVPCLDGGCADKIPVRWAVDNGFDKIIVVRTREREFRKKVKESSKKMAYRVYGKYADFSKSLAYSEENYNITCDEIDKLEREGRIFVIAPSKHVTVDRLEKDMEKLGALYKLGFLDTKNNIKAIREYLMPQP